MQVARPAPVTQGSSTIPSTKDRHYTPTLLPNPLDRKAGAILGSSACDFLGRKDAAPKLSSNPVQGQGNKGEVELPFTASTAPKAQKMSPSPAQKQSEKLDHKLPPTTAAIPMTSKPDSNSIQGQSEKARAHALPTNPTPTVSRAPERVSNLDLLSGLATDSDKTSIKAPTADTVDQPQTPAQNINDSDKELKRKSLFDIFNGEESDNEPDGDASDVQAKEVAMHDSNAANVLKYSPDELLKMKANAKIGVLPPDCIVKRREDSGKTNIAAAYKSATSFITHSTPSVSRPQTEMTESVVLHPAAPQTSPQQAKLDPVQAFTEVKAEPLQAEELITLEEVRGESKSKDAEKVQGTAPFDHQRWMSGLTYDPAALQTSPEHAKLDSIQALTNAKAETVQVEDRVVLEEFQGQHESQELRPQAPGFVPGLLHAPSATSVPTQDATLATIELNGNEAKQHASTEIFGSTGLMGLIVTTTPVHLSNGFFIAGPPTSQLMAEPPFNGTFSTELPLHTVDEKEGVVRAPRKPTKGLRASMWAK
jgi:hypothetical protein